MLSPETIEVVKSTVPILKEHGIAITTRFYERIFKAHPALKNIFNQTNQGRGDQPSALANAVLAYAMHIDNVEALLPAVARIAHKHTSLGVAAEHYPIVGENLLAAIQDTLNLPDGHPALVAWGEAYGVLADVFINAEEEIYRQNEAREGGWRGFREFVIKHVETETHETKSLYLEPVDGGTIPTFKAGQYVAVRVRRPGAEFAEIRQYSLTGESGKSVYRITPKAEKDGAVSNYLHTLENGARVEVAPPNGMFTRVEAAPSHVLLAGGVGLTPLISMLKEALADGISGNKILFVHCARDSESLIFKDELAELVEEHGVHYRQVLEKKHPRADHVGYLNAETLGAWVGETGLERSAFYICGPQAFMSAINQACLDIGVDAGRIHYETFGPTKAI